jgi:hypothetical protein
LDCFREFPGSALVCGAYRNIFDDGSHAPTNPQQRVSRGHYRRLLEGNFIGMHAAVLYRRELLDAAGGFDESLRACEDYELYLRMSRRWPIAQHAELVAEYRQHDTNMSKDYAFMLRSVLTVLRKERAHIPDREHSRALRNGIQVWKDYYGDLLLKEWGVRRGVRRFLGILRIHPYGVLRRAGHALRSRFFAWSERRWLRMGSFRRLSPVSDCFGFDRGLPVDRYYIATFLAEHAGDIHGHVLEIGGDEYSRRFGRSRVTNQDVLHVEPGFPGATIIADLSCAPHIPDARFDCIILTQTLHYIFDLHGAGRHSAPHSQTRRYTAGNAARHQPPLHGPNGQAKRLLAFHRNLGGAAVFPVLRRLWRCGAKLRQRAGRNLVSRRTCHPRTAPARTRSP